MDRLGARIRAAREELGLTLRATAARAGVSPSLLSQVETGKVRPSVSTLYAIASCLDLMVDDLLRADDAPARPGPVVPVQRHEDEPELTMENGVTWRRLASMGPGSDVDAVRVTYAPGGASSIDGTHMRHPGVEYGVMLSGELTLKLEFDTHRLRAGDSFCFDSTRPHFYLNDGDVPAEAIWFILGRTDEGADQHALRSAVDVMAALGRLPHEGAV